MTWWQQRVRHLHRPRCRPNHGAKENGSVSGGYGDCQRVDSGPCRL